MNITGITIMFLYAFGVLLCYKWFPVTDDDKKEDCINNIMCMLWPITLFVVFCVIGWRSLFWNFRRRGK